MMANDHPTEIELLDYAEGDADGIRILRSHVEACPACSATVAELERARATLRAAPLLELPAPRADAMLRKLPRQERDRPAWLELLRSPRRLALIAAPAAAAVAGVVALVVFTGNGDLADREAAPSAAVAEDLKAEAGAGDGSQADAGAGAAEAAPLEAEAPEEPLPPGEPPTEEATAGPGPVATVAGKPDEIARLLEEAGFGVRVADGVVTVTGAEVADVAKALENLPPGDDVPVFVEP